MGSNSKGRGKSLRQDYSSFKTPEATQAALNRQKKILDRNKTSTGAFVNQADELRNKGYTLNDTMDTVFSPTGGTVAGINKNNQLFSGNQDVSDILRRNLPQNISKDRVANTDNVLNQIYGLDEMSKAGEEQINRAFDGGRGVKFANNPNPADPFRVTSSQPTFLEVLGDIGRGLVGGTAKQTIPDLSIANQPRNQKGIIPALAEKGMIPGSMLFNAAKSIFSPEEESPAGGPGGLGLAGIRNFYEDNPYSVPTGRSLPLDYLQGGFNRLDEEEERKQLQQDLIDEILASDGMTNQGFTPEGFDFPVSNMGELSIGDTLPYIPSGASAGAPQDTGFDISEILKDKIIIDPSKGSRGSENFNSGNDDGGGSGDGSGGGSGGGSGQDAFTENQLLLIANFISAGFSRAEAEAKARSYKFAFGGSVAPQSGPMSEGVGTLYRMK